ncbi:MAG: class I SAM-dependent methyltransferase [Chitinophagales bacterium]|nr:class I SAM-dependent methyltransferase [Chitinophagales bacterium]
MKDAKDIFSTQAGTYAAYRPHYPDALFEYLYSVCKGYGKAWDCATGNGQVASRLSERFTDVYATDLSAQQVAHAIQRPNIHYSVQRAEHTNFADNSFDLITIGTALHWFDFDVFYKEAIRVAKDGAVIAAWAYAPFRGSEDLDAVVDDFTYKTLHDYWDPERKWVDEKYQTIPFPFEQPEHPDFKINVTWSFEHMIGYLNSWSSVQHYIRKHGVNPVDAIAPKLTQFWKNQEVKALEIPLFVKIGMIRK